MRVGILVTARLGSSRLKRKHLLPAAGKPLMSYLLERIATEFAREIEKGSLSAVIVSSDEPENRDFERFLAPGVQVFFGSIDNIPLRHHQAAQSLGLDAIVAVDGDDIVCSTGAMRAVFHALLRGEKYVRTSGLPFGMNAFGYAADFLAGALEGHCDEVLETGWGKIFSEASVHEIRLAGKPEDRLRFTLDYQEDYRFFQALIEALGASIATADHEEIVRVVDRYAFYQINENIAQEYWANFYRCMEREGRGLVGANQEYRRKAHKYIPAGAHTYSRADDSYPLNVPSVLSRGAGAQVWDMEDNQYLDFGMALRAVTVGYGYESIAQAAIKQIHNGNNLTRASQIEIEAAETLCNLIPWVEMVKFAKNGSNVTTAALKLARAYTGKRLIAKCAQHPFFSFDDWFIGKTIMDRGVPAEHVALTLDFNYNDIDSLAGLFAKHPGDIAAVIMEPATTDEPADNFLQKAKELCHGNGALLVLDEMITGFRWHLQGACRYYDVEPDLVTFGKGMANGFSVAAVGGRREIMELGGIDSAGERVFLLSTTHGAEMCGMGAFVETVKVYQEMDVVGAIWRAGAALSLGMNEIAAELGLAEQFSFVGLPCSPNFLTRDEKGELSLAYRTLFVQEMAKNRVLMPWVALSLSHGEAEISRALDAGRKSLEVYRRALNDGVEHYLEGRVIKPVFRKIN